MTPGEERAYQQGQQQAAIHLMHMAFGMLGRENLTPEQKWEYERAQTVQKLRQICDQWGDNDWPDNLHLADVLERHLWDHLEANCEDDPDDVSGGENS